MLSGGETQTERFQRDAYPTRILPMSVNMPGRSPVSLVTCAPPVIGGNIAGEHAFNIKSVGEIEKFPELYNYNLPRY